MSDTDIHLHYEELDGDGPHIMMLHGMLSSKAQWDLNIAAIQKVARPVLVELLAHGRSAAPEDAEPYDPEYYVGMFEAIRKKLGIETWFICGQSFGASLTLRYALRHPERIIAQVFTNSSSALAGEEYLKTYRSTAEERAQLMEQGGKEGIKELPIFPGRAKRLPIEARDALVRDAELLQPRGLAQTFRYSSPYLSVRAEAANTAVPTLLVHGAAEKRFQPNYEYAVAHIPNLRVVAANAGHAVNIEAADIFNEAITAWIEEHNHDDSKDPI
ncbi:MAG: alpha/beta fold hydrolase [Rhodospirillaceae bacterium]|jgi:2-succinyl-6-hydroxy-2,4-cyclohexadiene-1-carboxylate synthase|nr:alpha/beta fold hydrolase [Rhodospirillaceae bacterium]MBT6428724.1 alpha/beta fold hydrolase [Rhodospirillaceae bacterium]MBT7758277.1 alpha/beta fold hydrolase [Rhodospirillaceae bacterium]